jgi:uncharacterized membrane protein YkvA (DUF1232 family)
MFQKLSLHLIRIYQATPAGLRWLYWVLPVVYFIFPMDFLPDRLPILGRLDDILMGIFIIWSLDKAKLFDGFFKEAKQRAEGTETSGEAIPQKPHEILGVQPTASKAEIKKAYRRLMGLYHPDKFSHLGTEFEATARERSQAIIGAYEQLVGKG